VVRVDGDGRRRYLDALLVAPDGREVGVEIDGAPHMQADNWDRDLDRSNEIQIGGTLVLRFTATAIRVEPGRVAAQLGRALGIA
jgi:very-short-patch-repair endonuclease